MEWKSEGSRLKAGGEQKVKVVGWKVESGRQVLKVEGWSGLKEVARWKLEVGRPTYINRSLARLKRLKVEEGWRG